MSVIVKKVESKKEFKTFIDFPNKLYKGSPYFCPKLYSDKVGTLSPDKNPAFEFSKAEYYLAYKDNEDSKIPKYSTLIFDIQLARIYRYGIDTDTSWH